MLISVPSGPPEKLHCVALTSSTIQVSWHPPEEHLQNGVISGYKVVYAPHPGTYPRQHLMSSHGASITFPKVARVNTYTTVLDSLRKFTNYTIQVRGFTVAGDGPLSHIETCATHPDGKGDCYIIGGCPKLKCSTINRSKSVILLLAIQTDLCFFPLETVSADRHTSELG